jgi:hypothetical protein
MSTPSTCGVGFVFCAARIAIAGPNAAAATEALAPAFINSLRFSFRGMVAFLMHDGIKDRTSNFHNRAENPLL